MISAFGESHDLVFSPSRSNLGLVSSRLGQPVANREIYNLSMVSRPVLFKIKGTSWMFIFGCKNVPGSIFDDGVTLLQLFQVAKTCPGRFLTTVSHFYNFFRLQKRARAGDQNEKNTCGVGNLTTSTTKQRNCEEKTKRKKNRKMENRQISKIPWNKH